MNSLQHFFEYDEKALIKSASQGDLEAFNQLVLIYQDMAYRHAGTLLGDPDLAEDVTQESFIKVFRNIRDFRGGSFRSWLLRIITNTTYDLLRKSCSRPNLYSLKTNMARKLMPHLGLPTRAHPFRI